jgi:YVTN family beta-propeller protein
MTRTPSHSRRPRLAVRAGVLAVLVALVLLALACGGDGGGGQRTPGPRPLTAPTGVNPAGGVAGAGAVWVANAGAGTVWKLDARTGRRLATVPVGDAGAYSASCADRNVHQVPHGSFGMRDCDLPRGLALAGSTLWVIDGASRALLRVDAPSARVVARVPVGIAGWYVTAGPDAVWVSDYGSDSVVRVDPRTNAVAATIGGLPHGPAGLIEAAGALWVACSRADQVARIDPATNQMTAAIAVGHEPVGVAAGFGSVWVHDENEERAGTVTRVDGATGRVVASVPVGMQAGRDGLDGLAVTARGVWVPGLQVQRIDPGRGRVVERSDHPANALFTGDGALWSIDLGYSVTRLAG